MSWVFKEAQHSKLYTQHRPTYPEEVHKTILSWLPRDSGKWKTAVDVGCGTGQSTLPLCDYFEEVIGIDSSETQVNEARHVAVSKKKQNVKFMVGSADDFSFLVNDSVDLVTAATATHWFDYEKFFQEALRILKPGGVLAVYSYGILAAKKAEEQSIISQVVYILLFVNSTFLV
jgi:ubiquinone/menaquinone biosynthesis C-methylase UbiE